jgi:uncharacterized damage-inducible protein DinB
MQPSQPGDTSVLAALFQHNTWSNLRLLDFCERLSDEQLDSNAVGGYGTIRDTLLHSIRAEVSYVERVNGRLPAHQLAPDVFPGFAVLRDAARWAGDELLQLAASARADTRVLQRPPRDIIEYSLANLISQAITHSTEHRTQIATIITQLGLEPPDMSGWAYMDETGDLHEFGDAGAA